MLPKRAQISAKRQWGFTVDPSPRPRQQSQRPALQTAD